LLCWACLQVLRLLIRLYEECEQPDYVVICQCLMFLDDAPEVAKILNKLISSGSEVRDRVSIARWQTVCISLNSCQVKALCWMIKVCDGLPAAYGGDLMQHRKWLAMPRMLPCRLQHSKHISCTVADVYAGYLLITGCCIVFLRDVALQDDVLLAYQIAFDLVENELQSFIIKVRAGRVQLSSRQTSALRGLQ
jgi:hypothetical protein